MNNPHLVTESGLSPLIKSLIDKAKIGLTSKSVILKRSSEPRTYLIAVKSTQPLKPVSLKKLYSLFKQNNIKILNGSVFVGFTSGKLDTKTTISFKIKMMKTVKKSKEFRLKIGRNKTQEKIRAFVEEINKAKD